MPDGETPPAGTPPEPGSAPPNSTPGPADGTGTSGTPGQETWPGGEPFDAERARRLIDQLRPYETQAAQLKRENDELKAEVEAHRRAQLSELEQLQLQVRELTSTNEQLTGQLRETQLTHEITRLARTLGFADEDDASLMLDRSAINYEGERPTNLKALLERLLEHKPHLKGSSNGQQGPPPTPGRQANPSREQLVDLEQQRLKASGRYGRL